MLAKAGLVFIALTFAATTLERVAGTMGLVAGIIVSLGIIYAAGRQLWRFVRRLEAIAENTAALPEFMRDQRVTNERVQARLTEENERVHHRLDEGAARMTRIEASLDTWADAERAAVDAAIKASTATRPPRSTDDPPPPKRVFFRE